MKTTLCSNYYDWANDLFEDLKEYHIANDDMLTDDEIQCEVDFCIESDFENTISNLESYFEDYPSMLAVGCIGRWDDDYEGFNIYTHFDTLYYEMMRDCVFQEIYIEDGIVMLHGSHHDGDVRLKILPLNSKMDCEFYDWSMDLDDKRTDKEIFECVTQEIPLIDEEQLMKICCW